MIDSTIKAKIVDKLANYFGVTPSDASLDQMYKAVSLTVLDILMAKKKTFMHDVKLQKKKSMRELALLWMVLINSKIKLKTRRNIMMNKFKEQFDALKGKFQAKITADSTQEQIEEINGIVAELDALETSHNEVVTENAKFKDTIVRMVSTEGNGKTPQDDSSGSKSMSIEEAIAEVQKGGK